MYKRKIWNDWYQNQNFLFKVTTAVLLCFFVTFTTQATLIDSSSSSVNVKTNNTGQEYSYTIHESKAAFAIEPATAVTVLQHNSHPFIKAAINTNGAQQDNKAVQKIPVAIYRTVPLIQPYAYVHAHGYVYPYNLVAIDTAWILKRTDDGFIWNLFKLMIVGIRNKSIMSLTVFFF